jgi:hypothetical protein
LYTAAAKQGQGSWPLDRGKDKSLGLGKAQETEPRDDGSVSDKGLAALSKG